MPRSRPRRTRIRLLAAERAELERIAAARTSTQQAAYRAEIILRVADGQTDSAIAREMGLAVRTVFVWRHRFVAQRLNGLKDHPKCPPPREYHLSNRRRGPCTSPGRPSGSLRVGQPGAMETGRNALGERDGRHLVEVGRVEHHKG